MKAREEKVSIVDAHPSPTEERYRAWTGPESLGKGGENRSQRGQAIEKRAVRECAELEE